MPLRRFLPLLLLLWAFAYLPTLPLRNFRLEEGRRATPAWEMLHTGDLLTPRLYGDTYLSKPPLYFWTVAATKTLLGGSHDENPARWQLATRLPSAVGALLGALVLLAFARRTLSPSARQLAALAWLATVILLDKGTIGEIDAPLSSLVLASLALWYEPFDRNPASQPPLSTWLLAGLVMAAAVLLKGPGGPLQFYCLIIPFLFLQCGPRRAIFILLSPGNFLFLALAVAPALAWVAGLVHWDHFTVPQLLAIWGHQAALDEVGIMRTDATYTGFPWARYASFLPEVFTMTLPWSLWAIPALLPPVARWAGLRPPKNAPDPAPAVATLYRFLACGILGITTVFFLYPGAQTRHMMAVAFPMVALATLFITSPAAAAKLRPRLPANWTAQGKNPLLALATLLALSILIGWAIVSTLFVVKKAPSDITAIAHRQIDAGLPTTLPAYTTRTFASTRGNGYYNILFYAHLRTASTGGLHALPSPPPPAPFSLIAAPADLLPLADLYTLAPLGPIGVPTRNPPPLLILSATSRPAPIASQRAENAPPAIPPH
jgi:4-amino-4-deoxy-L-arabinose transferase-like glycosyltransferase